MQPAQQRVKSGEGLSAARSARLLRQAADRRIGLGQRRVAQEEAWRKPLDGAANEPVRVLGLDFPVDRDAQLLERAVGGEHMGDVAERVFMADQLGVGGDVDAPVDHILALMVARRDPQHLDRARGRRVVPADDAVGDVQAHGRTTDDDERQMTDDGRQI